ncbi:MAG: tRNA (guanosine(37)-N1)-methyltransferase TrmD [Oscillospiraceae bacterium]|nr:tRNA (guanosine(37)-N1)-methyltransferase TrmD [Oscillospiraceae bacterium]MBQ6493961.1 tRNA (guanosine(37)-N1)-methyltransferase TrmD [Erysipelotrichaceae bacterium]
MKITVLTIFPEMYEGFLHTSIISRIIDRGLAQIKIVNIRDYSLDKHHHVDDTPYGGGAGMLMKVDVLHRALLDNISNDYTYTVLTSPKARPLKQDDLIRFSKMDELVIVCGHYEGIDHRFERYVDEKVSIGDYVLTGGELPSMVLIDGILRLLDEGISADSLKEESFNEGLLEYPQYTRPVEYNGDRVPDVLQNGNHKEIRRYNLKMALKETLLNRPDLLDNHEYTQEERELLGEIVSELP